MTDWIDMLRQQQFDRADMLTARERQLYGDPAPRSSFTMDDLVLFFGVCFLAGTLLGAAWTWIEGVLL